MREPDDRIAELIAAALAGELTAAETTEFDRLRGENPWIDDQMRELGPLVTRLRQGDIAWTAPRDLDAVRDRVRRSVSSETAGSPQRAAEMASVRRPPRWIAPLLAAACLVVGVGVGYALPAPVASPVAGPPGTLGAIEEIQVFDDVPGIAVDAELVAHTWGTEAILEASGLAVGATYKIVFIGADGSEFSGGEVLGSEVPIVCQVNAAVMRADTVRFELRDESSMLVAHADLPELP